MNIQVGTWASYHRILDYFLCEIPNLLFIIETLLLQKSHSPSPKIYSSNQLSQV